MRAEAVEEQHFEEVRLSKGRFLKGEGGSGEKETIQCEVVGRFETAIKMDMEAGACVGLAPRNRKSPLEQLRPCIVNELARLFP